MKRLLFFACGGAAAVLLVPVVQFVCVLWDVFKPARRRPRRYY